MKIVTIYEARTVTNEYGAGKTIDWCLDEETAKELTKGHGWYTEYGSVIKYKAILDEDNMAYLLHSEIPVLINSTYIRKITLEKLTKIEKISLGVVILE